MSGLQRWSALPTFGTRIRRDVALVVGGGGSKIHIFINLTYYLPNAPGKDDHIRIIV